MLAQEIASDQVYDFQSGTEVHDEQNDRNSGMNFSSI